MLECWDAGIIKTMLARVKSASLAFGISRGKNAGLKRRWKRKCGGKVGMLGCWNYIRNAGMLGC
jgi:hypothetical protein